ncbi:MAG: hypothetical protein KME35_22485 [Aphanocapsa sp. GSE-SYN-MK-11-07L]|jgi:hypothetical protein|nr:hypothetical protein [Aphanocapsa sp. GSE-SYN-MK-11-07L]
MRSLWTVSYVGPHTAITVKKLERLLGIKAEELERERLVWNGEKIERAVFFVEHGTIEWSLLLFELLHKMSQIAVQWQTSGDAVNVLTASVSEDNANTTFQQKLPPGFRELAWTIRGDQAYRTELFLAGPGFSGW